LIPSPGNSLSFRRQVRHLEQNVLRMGALVEHSFRLSHQALFERNLADAGNDKYYLFNSAISTGGTPPPTQATQAGFLYTFPSPPTSPIPAGQTFTKTLTLSPAEIANNRVTLVVQDDTAVLQAKLELKYCCCECQFPIQ